MVSDVGDDDQIFRHREQRVDTRLAVGVVSVEEVHGSRNAHVVQKLQSLLESKTFLFESVFRFSPKSRLKEPLTEGHVEGGAEEENSETRSVKERVLAGGRCERQLSRTN